MYEYILFSTIVFLLIVLGALTQLKKRDRVGLFLIAGFALLGLWGLFILFTQFWLGGAA